MKRPELHKITLSEVSRHGAVMTMSTGQWDRLLQAAYDTGWTLVELDREEKPVAAYRRRING